MFCPPKYLNWEEIKQIAKNMAERVYLAQVLEQFGEDPKLPFIEDNALYQSEEILKKHKKIEEQKILNGRFFDTALIKFWIFTHILDNLDPCVCSPEGRVLKAPWPIFYHPDEFSLFFLNFPLRGMAELIMVYSEYDAGRMKEKDFWERFVCIDETTGTIKEKVQTARHFELTFFDRKPEHKEMASAGINEHVKPYLGWSIVIDQNNIPDTFEEWNENLGLGEKHWFSNTNHEVERTRKKLGRKPSGAKEEYYRLYPNGKPDEISYDAIEAELLEAGYKISSRSIQSYERKRRN